MAAFEALKEDIIDVFQLFNEDGSGCISIQEVARAIQTITGTRMSRVDLNLLIKAAREEMKEEALSRGAQDRQGGPVLAKTVDDAARQNADAESDVVDSDLFVAVVLKTLNRRTYEQETLFAFHLLEDKNYPGFITKESLKNATAEVGERITEQEVNEMFDKIVTGVPTAAVDFTTFVSILDAARSGQNGPFYMSPASACPLCNRSFGFLLWQHSCGVCRKTVCDDCAPKRGDRRVCSKCCEKVDQPRESVKDEPAHISDEEKRMMCLRAAEGRRTMQQQKRMPPQNQSTARISQPAPTRSQQEAEIVGIPQNASSREECTGTNPVFDAAMRRRQQEQLGVEGRHTNSTEKTHLLTEILAILQRRGEDEPFGLRSMDEIKLRVYLRYIKDKDGHLNTTGRS